ncbi:YceI family protein [Mesorhizobium koreense]|uniref:YceI family protein n=1 Tax=Mesorhizobium koreense TaxID=3074855 RepID=UPI00287BAC2E|nr:YceI family protein [Mesorhizobium sp. WR6]
MIFRNVTLAAVLLASLSAPSWAAAVDLKDAAGRYAITPVGSSLAFAVDSVAGKGISGKFAQYSGLIVIDGDIGRSSVRITIIPASVETGQDRVDTFLKSNAVFDVANEHAISFRSSNVRRTGESSAIITGTLTARGRSRPATFLAELEGLSRGSISFHVTGKVLRSPYGMDAGTPIYSNVVQFDMMLKARRK